MEAVKVEDITPETLDRIAWEWEETRIERLIRRNIILLGNEYRLARATANNLEMRCRIRAIQMHKHGMDPKEIAELFDVDMKEMRKWLKSSR